MGRFKLDENLPLAAESLLKDCGHYVETVLGEGLGGNVDTTVFDVSRSEQRILVTLDRDFSDIRLYPPSSHPGIWVLRPRSQSVRSVIALLTNALAVFESEPAARRLWIIEPRRVRIHE